MLIAKFYYGIVNSSVIGNMSKPKIKLILSSLLLIVAFMTPNIGLAASTDPCADTTNGGTTVDQTKVQNCLTQSPVVAKLQTVIDFLSAGVGIIIVGVIVVGGIQYTIAGSSPQALTAARQRITNGLIALFAFLFIFAFLQWLIPGGIFK